MPSVLLAMGQCPVIAFGGGKDVGSFMLARTKFRRTAEKTVREGGGPNECAFERDMQKDAMAMRL